MDISSVSNASFSRSVTPAKNSSDRHASEEAQAALVEAKALESREHDRAVQQKLQHSQEENQRRLDGRIISFGYDNQDDSSNQQNQASYNRSRVNEAYSAVSHDRADSRYQNSTGSQRSQQQEVEAIDIVV